MPCALAEQGGKSLPCSMLPDVVDPPVAESSAVDLPCIRRRSPLNRNVALPRSRSLSQPRASLHLGPLHANAQISMQRSRGIMNNPEYVVRYQFLSLPVVLASLNDMWRRYLPATAKSQHKSRQMPSPRNADALAHSAAARTILI